MQRNGYKLLKLINNLLDLNKLEEGRMRLKIRDVNLVAFIPPLLDSVKPLADQRKIRLYYQHPPHAVNLIDRPGPVRKGHLQPALQRPQVHQQGRQDHDLHR